MPAPGQLPHPRLSLRPSVESYLRAVGAAGGGALVWVVATHSGALAVSVATLLVIALLFVGEHMPIRVPGHDDEVTTSTAFSLALLVMAGIGPAAAAQALASITADVRLRKPLRTIMFNAGQYTLSLAAAASVIALSPAFPRSDVGVGAIGITDLAVMAAAAAAYFVVNNVLAGTAYALASHRPVLTHLREDLSYQTWTAALVMAFAPLVVGIAEYDALFIPFLLVPLLAIYRAGRDAQVAEHQAVHDRLTGLPNRALFRTRAGAALDTARQTGRIVATLMMDLDRFKEINDTLGHHHGDLLLEEVAGRLRQSLRETETIARFGGDEFAVLLPGLHTAEDAVRVGERLLASLRQPVVVNGLALRVDASIGIACAPEHGTDIDELLKRADIAMYVAKTERGAVQLYTAGDDSTSRDRLSLASDLRDAIDREQLVLHYQPQIDVATGELVGAEALMRWNHPERGMIPPDEFISLAEHTGTIGALTTAALRMAIADAARWARAGLPIPVSVNVSAQDVLGCRLPDQIGGLLDEYGVPAEALKLELTESMLMADPHRAKLVLDALKATGVRIAIDDFGTGYSSLAYLTRLPIDELKIDRSFIRSLGDHDHAVIVSSTIDLARRLNLRTVAEGVEDADTLATLAGLRCDIAQGYYFSRPVPCDDFLAWAAAAERPANVVRLVA